jgi:hypothetical protein
MCYDTLDPGAYWRLGVGDLISLEQQRGDDDG